MVNVDVAPVRQEASMYDLGKDGPDIMRTIQMRNKELIRASWKMQAKP